MAAKRFQFSSFHIPMLLVALFCVSGVFAQTKLQETSIPVHLHSGVLTKIDEQHEIGAMLIHIDALLTDETLEAKVQEEFMKYPSEIISFAISASTGKVYITYKNPLYPNLILAILDRKNIRGYYLEDGQEIRYVKDGNAYFKR